MEEDDHDAVPVKLFINEAFFKQSVTTTPTVKQEIDFESVTETRNHDRYSTRPQSDATTDYQLLGNAAEIVGGKEVEGDRELFRRSYNNHEHFEVQKEGDKDYSVSNAAFDHFEIKAENAEEDGGETQNRRIDGTVGEDVKQEFSLNMPSSHHADSQSSSQRYPNFLHSSSTEDIDASSFDQKGTKGDGHCDKEGTKTDSPFAQEGTKADAHFDEEETKAGDQVGPSVSDPLRIEHQQNHERKRQFDCSVCKMIFNRSCNLRTHMRTHTGEKPYSCSLCPRAFADKSSLNTHMMMHTGEKPFICSICNKSFIKCAQLQIHIRIHTGERPYECSLCDKTFTDASNLRVHIKTHTNEKPFMCSICDKAFGENRHLQRHIRTHTGEKPYECQVCLNAFTDKSTLNSHMRTHTGEKRHVCVVCDKGFVKGSNLKTHMRIHTGEKPYACPVCAKAFSKSYHVKKHMKTHMKDKPVTVTDPSSPVI